MSKKKPMVLSEGAREALCNILQDEKAVLALHDVLDNGHTDQVPMDFVKDFADLGFKIGSHIEAEYE